MRESKYDGGVEEEERDEREGVGEVGGRCDTSGLMLTEVFEVE